MVDVTDLDDNETSNAPVLPEPSVLPADEDGRTCWICFDGDQGEPESEWVQPCLCRGTTKWVHQDCIKRWIDEKNLENPQAIPECPQCKTKYLLIYPESGILLHALDKLEEIERMTCPYVIAVLLGASAYWCVLSFGALTVMEVVGHVEALSIMDKGDPLVIAIGLPFIPVMIAVGRMIPWEDCVLNFMRRVSAKIEALRGILPQAPRHGREESENRQNVDPLRVTRAICGVVMLPTMATWLGNVWFPSVRSNLQRALLGGATYIIAKGIMRMYYKQKSMIRREKRRIANFNSGSPADNPVD